MEMEGKVLGRCRLTRKLGQGGMGAVFLARHETLEKDVAVKILPQSLADNEEFIQRFLREARSAAQLDHPNVVRVLDAGSEGGTHYIVMEYVDGADLQRILNKKGKLALKDALAVTKKVAQALAAAHKLGIIHRDIKPANIMITKQGRVYVSDFGLSRKMDAGASLTTGDQVLGTPHYLSPEQGRGEKMDGRTDLYSLGATLYCMLTGRPPYTGTSPISIMMKHTSESDRPEPLRKLDPSIPAEVEALVQKMMAKNPAERFPSADEVVGAIDRARGGPQTLDHISPDMVLTPQKRRRLLMLGAGAGLGGFFLLIFFLVLISPGKAERAFQEASKAPTEDERHQRYFDVAQRFPGKWGDRARAEAAEIGRRIVDEKLKEAAALTAGGKAPLKEALGKLERAKSRLPEHAKRIEAKEAELNRARLVERTRLFGEYARAGAFEKEGRLVELVDPERVRKVGPGLATAGIRFILGISREFGGKVVDYEVRPEEVAFIPLREGRVGAEVTIQKKAGGSVKRKVSIHWTWVAGDWYLDENPVRDP